MIALWLSEVFIELFGMRFGFLQTENIRGLLI